MIEFEGAMLLASDVSAVQLPVSFVEPTEETVLSLGATVAYGSGEGALLHDLPEGRGDEWIASLLSSVSPGALDTGMISLSQEIPLDPQQTGEDIYITGKRPSVELDFAWDTGGGSGTGSTGGYSGGSGYAAPVAEHTQDCSTEDGAAVQVAKHVKGELPAGVSGPADSLKTSTGNDWTKVEFGTMIVKNPDGSFGALNNTIYSNDLPGDIRIAYSPAQPVQGLWHSHPGADLSTDLKLIGRYPSLDDWAMLERIKAGAGSVANPSLWIMDHFGTTREFKYDERQYFKDLHNDQSKMKDGQGLEGRERSESCG